MLVAWTLVEVAQWLVEMKPCDGSRIKGVLVCIQFIAFRLSTFVYI